MTPPRKKTKPSELGARWAAATGAVEREVLRLLWVLHFASTSQLARLVWGTYSTNTSARLRPTLRRMYATNLIWREPLRFLPGFRGHAYGQLAGGWFYGLTETGKVVAAQQHPELTTLHCLTREGYLSLAARRTLLHAAHYTEYCTRLIEDLRFHPLTVSLFIETESTILGSHVRMDGLIRLRRWQQRPPSQRMPPRDPWFVPWSTSLRAASVRRMHDVTFALEIDEGTEPLAVLYRKAENYKRTYVGGMYQRDPAGHAALPTVAWDTILCPTNTPADREARKYFFPVPLVIVPSAQRLTNVFAAWQRGWPGSEVRMSSWEHINQGGSIIEAPYLNQHREWVDWLGYPHPHYTGHAPEPSIEASDQGRW